MNTQITIEQLTEKLNGSLWVKGDLKRIYLNEAGYNTKKMYTKTFVFQDENGDFKVSCKVDCPSQPWQWCKSQEDEVKEGVYEQISEIVEDLNPQADDNSEIDSEINREGEMIQFVIVSPCYRANGFLGKYISYCETDKNGELIFGHGDHFLSDLKIHTIEGDFSNIYKAEGCNYSDDFRPISIKRVKFNTDQIKERAEQLPILNLLQEEWEKNRPQLDWSKKAKQDPVEVMKKYKEENPYPKGDFMSYEEMCKQLLAL